MRGPEGGRLGRLPSRFEGEWDRKDGGDFAIAGREERRPFGRLEWVLLCLLWKLQTLKGLDGGITPRLRAMKLSHGHDHDAKTTSKRSERQPEHSLKKSLRRLWCPHASLSLMKDEGSFAVGNKLENRGRLGGQ